MGRDRAAYMREYRARKRVVRHINEQTGVRLPSAFPLKESIDWREDRIRSLEAEVRYLKAELAKRPPDLRPFNSRPFTSVPKR